MLTGWRDQLKNGRTTTSSIGIVAPGASRFLRSIDSFEFVRPETAKRHHARFDDCRDRYFSGILRPGGGKREDLNGISAAINVLYYLAN
jgi:hypothetical protein